ncbi:protein of unknown function [Taphrina deformans PYCC 5710]|uniref:Uncharacterized protein n=1 Tax=Taphrina deformans (strain PYCC 5710 / ATCC 11124 / CBS 356.35 / IMI 108563 / JCM 9778 / NBRC 8474) TaxID=1097556 RepID=R4XEI1_TAPDE|nr:protein of unknown function [Taphrina deformans PYCC 5710]|eukprot:CCG84171.1 protein of unknown function [Taphrina deformans PYCC 5710]
MSYDEGAGTSPMIALMRECINTPCRGSDLGAQDLITVVRQEYESPVKRTGLRSARKSKAVSFEDVPSPHRSARKRRNDHLHNPSPRKPLASIPNNENVRPVTSDHRVVDKKQRILCDSAVTDVRLLSNTNSDKTTLTDREEELNTKIEAMSYEIEEKDQKIAQLTSLVKFLSAEVKIYTQSLEQQVEAQQSTIAALENRSK